VNNLSSSANDVSLLSSAHRQQQDKLFVAQNETHDQLATLLFRLKESETDLLALELDDAVQRELTNVHVTLLNIQKSYAVPQPTQKKRSKPNSLEDESRTLLQHQALTSCTSNLFTTLAIRRIHQAQHETSMATQAQIELLKHVEPKQPEVPVPVILPEPPLSATQLCLLGDRAFFGHGMAVDHARALVLYELAARAGSVLAMASVGEMYLHGAGTGRPPAVVAAAAALLPPLTATATATAAAAAGGTAGAASTGGDFTGGVSGQWHGPSASDPSLGVVSRSGTAVERGISGPW
jgi:hypothetical protein